LVLFFKKELLSWNFALPALAHQPRLIALPVAVGDRVALVGLVAALA
jgi:hypothetical protein